MREALAVGPSVQHEEVERLPRIGEQQLARGNGARGIVPGEAQAAQELEAVRLRGDGSFTVRMSLPNQRQVIPVVASAANGGEQRTIVLAIERIGASLTAQAGTIGPLSTIFMAVFFLDEPFTIWIAVGTVLVLLGIWLLTRAQPASAAAS